jgi:hypothetical protein
MYTRVPQEPGRSRLFHRGARVGDPVNKSRPAEVALVFAGTKQRAQRWYRQTKATKCGGMGGEKSELLNTT